MKILVLGKNGQVGWELQHSLAPLGEVTALDRTDLDLADADAIRQLVRKLAPRVVVNAAAYTAVDKAESEPELAMAVNGTAPGILAEEAERLGALLIHYSTDYVFDGKKSSPYLEEDPPSPLNVYGETKLAGERAIGATAGKYVILRTSWVYGLRGRNFMMTMLRLAGERDEIQVVDDQVGAPTWSGAIAEATCRVVRKRLDMERSGHDSACNGIFHLTASGSTSWFGFAREIILRTQARRARSPALIPVGTSGYPTAAKRPKNSVLSNARLQDVYGFALPPWEAGLGAVLDEQEASP